MVTTTNLLSYWKMDESSGDMIDAHGSTDGSVVGATQNSLGKINTGYSFDGTNDYVDVSQSMSGDVVFACWFRVNNVTTTQVLFDNKNNAGTATRLLYVTGSKLRFLSRYSGTNVVFVDSATISNDTWYFGAGVQTATGIKVYLNDDAPVETTQASLETSWSSTVYLGTRTLGADLDLNGYADESQIWSSVSDQDVLDLYNSGDALPYPFTGGSTPDAQAIMMGMNF